jgi:hypothetical protein
LRRSLAKDSACRTMSGTAVVSQRRARRSPPIV